MRIAMVSEHASPLARLGGVDAGGQNVHVAALATGLARLGHLVEVYTRRDDADTPEVVDLAPGVAVIHVPAGPPVPLPKDDLLPHMAQFGEWLQARWARGPAPDVVHAHHWMSALAAMRACADLAIPVAVTFHALDVVRRRYLSAEGTGPPRRAELEADLARRADLVIATCTDEERELRAMGATAPVAVIPCGVDTATFTPAGPASPAGPAGPAGPGRHVGDSGSQEPAGAPRALLVGRLVPRKGFDLAVRALAQLPELELVIVGGPAEAELDADAEAQRLLALARQLGVADRLVLTGGLPHEQMPPMYRSADVVLATPWYEPFGITPLEAAACGRPVVGTAVGGLLDTVDDGVTGWLIPPGEVDSLVCAVRAVLRDRRRAALMGAAARRRMVERYDWEVVARRTEAALAVLVRSRAVAGTAAVPPAGAERWLSDHVPEVRRGLDCLLEQATMVERWGRRLAGHLGGGGRLLVAGNGGSAAETQHLTAELVGRFDGERRPLSAIALTADTASLTAVANDYGVEEVFARQVGAHGRPGDILLLLSTSGRSRNVCRAAERARALGLRVWSLTGALPNPLAERSDEVLAVPVSSVAAVQEIHLMAVHALCAAVDAALARPASIAREALAPDPLARDTLAPDPLPPDPPAVGLPSGVPAGGAADPVLGESPVPVRRLC